MKVAGGGFSLATVEDVFRDLQSRRAGLLKALTTDFRKLYDLCDPNKGNLSLYGHPNGTWEVKMPADEVPLEIPAPVLGINFSRDGITERKWRIILALHSDLWLLSMAFYYGALHGFGKADRKHLFTMINDLPSLLEVMSGQAKEQTKENSNRRRNKSKSNSTQESQRKHPKTPPKPKYEDEYDGGSEEEGVDGDEHDDASCSACEHNYSFDEFRICSDDVCEKRFHGTSMKITQAQAEYIANILEDTMLPQ